MGSSKKYLGCSNTNRTEFILRHSRWTGRDKGRGVKSESEDAPKAERETKTGPQTEQQMMDMMKTWYERRMQEVEGTSTYLYKLRRNGKDIRSFASRADGKLGIIMPLELGLRVGDDQGHTTRVESSTLREIGGLGERVGELHLTDEQGRRGGRNTIYMDSKLFKHLEHMWGKATLGPADEDVQEDTGDDTVAAVSEEVEDEGLGVEGIIAHKTKTKTKKASTKRIHSMMSDTFTNGSQRLRVKEGQGGHRQWMVSGTRTIAIAALKGTKGTHITAKLKEKMKESGKFDEEIEESRVKSKKYGLDVAQEEASAGYITKAAISIIVGLASEAVEFSTADGLERLTVGLREMTARETAWQGTEELWTTLDWWMKQWPDLEAGHRFIGDHGQAQREMVHILMSWHNKPTTPPHDSCVESEGEEQTGYDFTVFTKTASTPTPTDWERTATTEAVAKITAKILDASKGNLNLETSTHRSTGRATHEEQQPTEQQPTEQQPTEQQREHHEDKLIPAFSTEGGVVSEV